MASQLRLPGTLAAAYLFFWPGTSTGSCNKRRKMATIDVSDCCLVCADPLEWTGVGVCGHKEICSRCVARMRFVLKDNNCVLCKQESPAVFFTRFMGDYTARVPAEDYPAKLKVRCHGYLPAWACQLSTSVLW